jgi:glycosyltransferase involved in cell wall biosynthesis
MPSEPAAPSQRPRLLLSAFSCIPYRGSEPGVGWNRALEAAKYCDTWVMCRAKESEEPIRRYFEEHQKPRGLHFIYVPEPRWGDRIRCGTALHYLVYNAWQRRAYQIARRLHQELNLDLAHHVSMIGFREPGFLWKLNVPFIWGPLGGTQNYPWRCLAGAGPKALAKEAVRSLVNRFQLRYSHRVKRAARAASVVLAANSPIASDIRRFWKIDAPVFPETGLRSIPEPCEVKCHDRCDNRFTIVWSGVLEPRKALELLLEALGQLPTNFDYQLRVLGEGPCQARWQRLADRLGVAEHVRWLGRRPHQEALAEFKKADVFAFTSLRDTSGTVNMEALGAGLPVICVDHQGVRDVVSEECGIKVPVTSRKEIAKGLRDGVLHLAKDGDLRQRLGEAARRRAERYLWSYQGRQLARIYDDVLQSSGCQRRCEVPPLTDFQESAA